MWGKNLRFLFMLLQLELNEFIVKPAALSKRDVKYYISVVICFSYLLLALARDFIRADL